MKKLISIFTAALLVISLCACNNNNSNENVAKSDYPASAFDLTVDACPQKVISLSPAVTEIITELGSDAQLAGVSDNCVTDKDLARVGTSLIPDFDTIKSIKPDVVFVTAVIDEKDKKALSATGAVVIAVSAPNSYGKLLDTYINIAKVMSGNITGTRNANTTFNRIDEQIKKLAAKASDKKVAVFFNSEMLIPTGSIANEIISLGGGKNIADKQNMGDAEIIANKPDVILCDAESYDAIKERFSDFKVEQFDVTLLESRGSKMVDAVKKLCEISK